VNGYANLIAARLRKLAEEGSTGTLPVSGRGDGAIFFRDGRVVYAHSTRTPPASPHPDGPDAFAITQPGAAGTVPGAAGSQGREPAGEAGSADRMHTGGGALVPVRSVSWLEGILEPTELILDALTELLSSESRYAKFRPAKDLTVGRERPIPVEALLEEVQRRHDVLRQLAAAVTPDTTVAQDPFMDPLSVQVSPGQWALVMRVGDQATPRGLALHLGRSVFGTTIEVYRLLELGLVVVPGRAPAPGGADTGPRPARTLSFVGAVSGGRDSDA
jgi:hypothetical protein